MLEAVRLTPKTFGLPPDLLKQLEARAALWNSSKVSRPPGISPWEQTTWADVIRHAAAEYLERTEKKAAKKRRRS